MEKRRCAACGEAFSPRPQVPEQKYCGKAACRRSRRRGWQQAKREKDADYREDQARAQQAWVQRNGGYWRDYRLRHPEYCEGNRKRSRERQAAGRSAAKAKFAKMDSLNGLSAVRSGTYLLVPQDEEKFAKMDSLMVEITLLSKT
jgi:hypothetical protein